MRNVPGISECYRLMEEYGMLPNIRHHSIMVARVAWEIVEGLRNNDTVPQPVAESDLVVAGALLHDIAKTPCLRSGCDHAEAGAEICLSLGYPEIAVIVEEHVLLGPHDPDLWTRGCFSAREIIYYADKRVRHEEIVSLEERLQYILEHYGGGDPGLHERIRENFAACEELEDSIFSFLPFAPGALPELVASRDGISFPDDSQRPR